MAAARLLDLKFSLTLHGSDLLLHRAYLDVKLQNCRFCLTAFASPAYYLNQLVRRVEGASSQGPPLMHIAILTGFTLALTAIALRRLKRVG